MVEPRLVRSRLAAFLQAYGLNALINALPHLRLKKPLQMTHPKLLCQDIDVDVAVDVLVNIVESIIGEFGVMGLCGGFHGFLVM